MECVDSVLAQTYHDMEIILVNDGSTDSSPKICDEYAQKDKRIKVIHQDNQGVSAARNNGIAQATGQYVAFVDGDDTIHPQMIAHLLGLIQKHKASIAICGYSDSPMEMQIVDDTRLYSTQQAIELTLYQRGLDPSLCAKLYPIEAIKAAPQRIGMRYEDLDAFYRIYEASPSPLILSKSILYYYRRNPDSFIHNFTHDRLDVLKVVNDIERHYQNDPIILKAAKDRKFSANCNMFILTSQAGQYHLSAECWEEIKRYRNESLLNSKVRLKNKLGALLSYFGKRAFIAVSNIV